tara:strand:+ start:64 stop:582 length:519 start_codon:yes stop_codon:yes gene_type:complete
MLLRHASAEPQGYNQEEDHEKPLDEQGKLDCKKLSDWLKKSFLDFDLVISSDAIRALQTSSLVFDPLNISVKKNDLFYLCSYEEILKYIKNLDNNISNIVVVGHEPSMSETMRELVSSVRPDLENYLKSAYMPCTMSFIYFNKKNWNELEKGDGLLEAYISPKILNEKNEKN